MNTFVPRPPFGGASLLRKRTSEIWRPIIIGRRHQTSFRRTKQRLRVKPDPSFAPSDAYTQDHIIFNPPSSAPSVYHTPSKFLPPGDRRREILAPDPDQASQPETSKLPPPVRKPYEKSYHLTAEEISTMRMLRQENPELWTREKLAKKFNCSNLFVGIVVQASEEHKAKQQQKLEAVKKRWGPRRRTAREDRTRRRELWGREG